MTNNIFYIYSKILSLNERKKFFLLTILNSFTPALDLLAIYLISTSYLFVNNSNFPFKNVISSVYFHLGITSNISISLLILGLFFLLLKTLFNFILTRKIFRFLGELQGNIQYNLTHRLFNNYHIVLSKFNFQEIFYFINLGVNKTTIVLLGSMFLLVGEIILIIILLFILLLTDPINLIILLSIFMLSGLLLQKNLSNQSRIIGDTIGKNTIKVQQKLKELSILRDEIYVSNKDNYFLDEIKYFWQRLGETRGSQLYIQQVPKIVMEISLIIGITFFTFYQFVFSKSENYIFLILIFSVVGIRLLPSILKINNIYLTIKTNYSELVNFHEFIALVYSLKEINSSNENSITLGNEILDFEVRNIHLIVPNGNSVKNINFSLKQGDYLHIIGKNGVGKSTLLKTLLTINKPIDGLITLNTFSIEKIIENNSGLISYVPQQINLINGSLIQNIALGIDQDNINHAHIQNIILNLNLKDLMIEGNNNFDRMILENGSNLSGGQIQRIGIARALYSQPKLLFIDEFANSLDFESELIIHKYLRNYVKGRIIVSITHNLDSIIDDDLVLSIGSGNYYFGQYKYLRNIS